MTSNQVSLRVSRALCCLGAAKGDRSPRGARCASLGQLVIMLRACILAAAPPGAANQTAAHAAPARPVEAGELL